MSRAHDDVMRVWILQSAVNLLAVEGEEGCPAVSGLPTPSNYGLPSIHGTREAKVGCDGAAKRSSTKCLIQRKVRVICALEWHTASLGALWHGTDGSTAIQLQSIHSLK